MFWEGFNQKGVLGGGGRGGVENFCLSRFRGWPKMLGGIVFSDKVRKKGERLVFFELLQVKEGR